MRLGIDQAQTFAAVIFMGSEPKAKFEGTGQMKEDGKEKMRLAGQDTNADGIPKWSVQVSLAPRHIPGAKMQDKPEMVNISFTTEKDPGEGVHPGLPVELVNLAFHHDKQRGMAYWSASEVRPLNAVPAGKSKAEG